MANLTWNNNGASTGSYGKVGHQSGSNNNDAIWSFSLSQTGASKITSVTFSLKWDNDAAGTGWKGQYTYVFAVSTSSAAGRTAATGTHLGKATKSLSGASGSTTVTISGLSLTPGTTYYLRANQNGTTKSTLKCFPKTGQTVTVAAYDKLTYTITYNKGTYGSGTNTTATKTYGTALTLKGALFTRTGYKQTAWASNAAGTTKAYDLSASYTANAAATLYPYWTANVVKIAYHPNGSTITSADYTTNDKGWVMTTAGTTYFDTLSYGQSDDPYNASTFGLTKTGYSFSGWKMDASNIILDEGTSYDSTKYCQYNDASKTTANTSTVTCYLRAQWTPNTYTVTFNLNGGTSSTTSKTVTYDSTYGTLPTPTHEGYTFDGWYDSNGNKIISSSTVSTASNHTLTAHWTVASFTLTLDVNGGTLPSGSSATSTQNYAAYCNLPIPTKPSYKFKGWYMNFDGTNFVKYGKACKWEDILNIHFNAYMDDWSECVAGTSLVSCTESGGWSLYSSAGNIAFEAYSASSSKYIQAKPGISFASLSAGWHTFDAIRAVNGPIKLYIDGTLVVTSETFTGNIGYNAANGIFAGAEASSTETTPQAGTYFTGKIGNLMIYHSNTDMFSADDYTIYRMPAQNITLYAAWELDEFTVKFDSNGGTSSDLSSYNQTFNYQAETAVSIPDPKAISLFKFGNTHIKNQEWNTEPDGSGFSLNLSEGVNSNELKDLALENNSSLTFYANWRTAGRIALYTSQTEKVFVFPRVCTDATNNIWTRAMAYVYKDGEWKPTIEPIGGLENTITIYPDYPVGENSINLHNVITGSTNDLIYPSV